MHVYRFENKQRKSSLKDYAIVIFSLVVIGFLIFLCIPRSRSISGIPDPIQTSSSGEIDFNVGRNSIHLDVVANYEIEGLVVHVLTDLFHYPENIYLPRDIGLAWGVVAEHNEELGIKWGHNFSSTDGSRYLEANSFSPSLYNYFSNSDQLSNYVSNNHIIPSDFKTYLKLLLVKVGDHIRIRGNLVNVTVTNPNGSTKHMETSQIREDQGCEIIYTTSLEFLQ